MLTLPSLLTKEVSGVFRTQGGTQVGRSVSQLAEGRGGLQVSALIMRVDSDQVTPSSHPPHSPTPMTISNPQPLRLGKLHSHRPYGGDRTTLALLEYVSHLPETKVNI